MMMIIIIIIIHIKIGYNKLVILFLNKTSMGDKIACEKGCGELIPLTQILFFYQMLQATISQPNGFKFLSLQIFK